MTIMKVNIIKRIRLSIWQSVAFCPESISTIKHSLHLGKHKVEPLVSTLDIEYRYYIVRHYVMVFVQQL